MRKSKLPRQIRPSDEINLYEMGCRIRKRRTELGLSLEEVADAIGYDSVKSLSRIELGERNCTSEKLYLLSSVLDLSVDYMLFGNDGPGWNTESERIRQWIGEEHLECIADLFEKLMSIRNGGIHATEQIYADPAGRHGCG